MDDFFINVGAGIVIVILAIFIYAIGSLIIAIPLYFLWNWLMPTIFGTKIITFLQAWGLSFLTSLLFKNYSSSNKH